MKIFSGLSFWVVCFNQEKKISIEEGIQKNGGFISSTLRGSTRVIFTDPTTIEGNQIEEFIKSYNEVERYDQITGNCRAISEEWIYQCIKHKRLINWKEYLIVRIRLLGESFWRKSIFIESGRENPNYNDSNDGFSTVKIEDTNELLSSVHNSTDKVRMQDPNNSENDQEDLYSESSSEDHGDQINIQLQNLSRSLSRRENQENFQVSSSTKSNHKKRSVNEPGTHSNENLPVKRLNNRNWKSQGIVQPRDLVVFNALIKDLNQKVQNGYFDKNGLNKYLKSQKMEGLYRKYRILIRDKVQGLPSAYNKGGRQDPWNSYAKKMGEDEV